MKILVMIDWYYPAMKSGGPAVSINNICNIFKEEHEFYIITSNHDLDSKEKLIGINEGWNLRNNSKVLYLSDKQIKYNNLRNIVNDINPDLIYINSLFGYRFTVPSLLISYWQNYKVLLAPRGEICKNTFKKKYKKVPYILLLSYFLRKNNIFYQSTSDEETEQLKKILRVRDTHIIKLPNIPSIPEELSKKEDKKIGELKCVFLSRIQEKKNLIRILNFMLHVNGKVSLDIYGPIEDEKYWTKCKQLIKNLPTNITVEYKGILEKSKVHQTLSTYQLFILPTKSENYGHVIAEALLSGCPILISDQTPWTDINETSAGWALPLNSDYEFINIINEVTNMDQNEYFSLVERSNRYIEIKLDLDQIKNKYSTAFDYIARCDKNE